MAKKQNVIAVNRGVRLVFDNTYGLVQRYCAICDNWTCGSFRVTKKAVRKLLTQPLGHTCELGTTGYEARQYAGGRFKVGCTRFQLKPTALRKIRKWANG